jgi:uncharacterized protein (TIGR02246 family)
MRHEQKRTRASRYRPTAHRAPEVSLTRSAPGTGGGAGMPAIALVFVTSAFAAWLNGCATPASDTMDTPPPDPAELMEADRTFAEETARSGVEGWVAAFAEDGAMVIPGRELRGHEAIRELMTPAFANPGFSLSWEPHFADVGSGGDLGYTIGRWVRQVVGPEGDTIRAEGQYATVWRRGEDGVWRAVLDLGVPDPEPQEEN